MAVAGRASRRQGSLLIGRIVVRKRTCPSGRRTCALTPEAEGNDGAPTSWSVDRTRTETNRAGEAATGYESRPMSSTIPTPTLRLNPPASMAVVDRILIISSFMFCVSIALTSEPSTFVTRG
jgi:hypothetical protein